MREKHSLILILPPHCRENLRKSVLSVSRECTTACSLKHVLQWCSLDASEEYESHLLENLFPSIRLEKWWACLYTSQKQSKIQAISAHHQLLMIAGVWKWNDHQIIFSKIKLILYAFVCWSLEALFQFIHPFVYFWYKVSKFFAWKTLTKKSAMFTYMDSFLSERPFENSLCVVWLTWKQCQICALEYS